MEEEQWMYYCEDPKAKQLAMCNIKDLHTIQTYKINVPYDSLYSFDTVRIKYYVYFTGGGNPGSEQEPEQYFPITMRMTVLETMETVTDKLANMNVSRANHAMEAASDKRLYVVGGANSSGNTSSCEEYDIATNKWKNIAPLNEAKKWITLCMHKNRYLYAFGGYVNDKQNASELIECMDIGDSADKPWEIVKIESGHDLIKSTYLSGVVPVSDTTIIVFGGICNGKNTDACAAFDPTKKTFEKRSSISKPNSFYGTKYGMNGDKFSIVGSHDGGLYVYDIKNDKWEFTPKSIWNPNYGFMVKSDTY